MGIKSLITGKHTTPAQKNLERDITYAVARLGKHYGRENAHALVLSLAEQLHNPKSLLSVTIDGLTKKEEDNE